MAATYADQRASVQAAIAKIETKGQQYEVANEAEGVAHRQRSKRILGKNAKPRQQMIGGGGPGHISQQAVHCLAAAAAQDDYHQITGPGPCGLFDFPHHRPADSLFRL